MNIRKLILWMITYWFLSLPLLADDTIVSLAAEFEKLSPEQRNRAAEISSELRCPTCTGLSVLQSDAPFSLQIRSTVIDQVKEGKSRDEILSFFTERYGLWILREPPKQGFHLFAWFIPILLLVLGPMVLIYLFRKNKLSAGGGVENAIRSREEILKEFKDRLQKLAQSEHEVS